MRIPETLPESPMALFTEWLTTARETADRPNANAMVLATVGRDGQPAARVVLLKGFEPDPGYAVFYTNYRSAKGTQLESSPHAAAVFHWDRLGRQIRLEGPVTRSPDSESDAYFASRDLESRVGAWASEQSEPIDSAEQLARRMDAARERFGSEISDNGSPVDVPRPPHWGGYRLWISAVEFWAHGDARLHDRARWDRNIRLSDGAFESASVWTSTRLQP